MFLAPARGDRRLPPMDPVLLASVLSLLVFGIVMVTSTSLVVSSVRYNSSLTIVTKWFIYIPPSLFLMWFLARIDFERYSSLALPILFLGMLTLLTVFIPGLGVYLNGAHRWISFAGVSFQPVELVKPAIIFYMASYLSAHQDRLSSFKTGILPMLFVLGAIDFLLMLQPDFGNTVLITITCFAMWLVGGVPLRHLLFLVAATIPLGALAIVFEPYRMKRFVSYLEPWADPQGSGYQLIQSMLAFGHGGLLGQGLGHGTQKLLYLPEVFTDFISAGIAEELGLLGILFLIGAYIVLALRSFYVAFQANDILKVTLIVGAISFIVFSATINMASVMTLIPTKGMPLPFVSYGGSALLGNSILMGMLFAIQRSNVVNVRRPG